MSEYIHLIGAEDVRTAGCTMQSAANDMNRAASNVEDSLERQRRFMDDWLMRLEEVVGKLAIEPKPGCSPTGELADSLRPNHDKHPNH